MHLRFNSFNQKIIMATFVTFLCLVFFYYPIASINLSFFHSDDTVLINRVANIDSFSSFCDLLFKPFAYKIRPIANLQYLIEFLSFGHNYNLYILYNILLVTISIFMTLLMQPCVYFLLYQFHFLNFLFTPYGISLVHLRR